MGKKTLSNDIEAFVAPMLSMQYKRGEVPTKSMKKSIKVVRDEWNKLIH